MATAVSRSWEEQRRRAFFWGLVPALAVLAVITIAPIARVFGGYPRQNTALGISRNRIG